MNIFFSRVLGLTLLMATSAGFAQSQASSVGFNFAATAAPCPKTVDGYTAGQTNASAVTRCLGNPAHEDHNPDGHFVYIYNLPEGQMTAFLFDSGGMLVRTRSYAHKVETPTLAAHDWVQLSRHAGGNTSFVDRANSRRDGKMYQAWFMTNYAKPVASMSDARSEIMVVSIDCESEQWALLAGYDYSEPNGEGKTLSSVVMPPSAVSSFPINQAFAIWDVFNFGCNSSK